MNVVWWSMEERESKWICIMLYMSMKALIFWTNKSIESRNKRKRENIMKLLYRVWLKYWKGREEGTIYKEDAWIFVWNHQKLKCLGDNNGKHKAEGGAMPYRVRGNDNDIVMCL